jgi:putative peptide zinc metalloprotease protein
MEGRDAASGRLEAQVLEAGNGRCIRLSGTAHLVLTRIDEGADADEVARELSGRLGRAFTAAHVRAAYTQVREQVDAIARQTTPPRPFGLWFRVRLLRVSVVARLSRALSGAFHPAVAWPLATLVVAAAVSALAGVWAMDSGPASHMSTMAHDAFLPLLGLFTFSMLAHELGHASASMRFGAPARDIGFGLYLVFPVFYSDVTSAWRLTRRQRVVIDLAGVYFQFVVGTAYLIIYRLTGWGSFYTSAVTIFVLALVVVLPIFKFDGYWLLTDLLGVENLSRQVRRVAVHALDRLRGRRGPRLPWPRWVSVAVLLYGVFTVAYIVILVVNLAPAVPRLLAAYPAHLAGLARDLYLPPHTPATGRLDSVIGPTYILLGVTMLLVTLSRRVIGAVRGRGTGAGAR